MDSDYSSSNGIRFQQIKGRPTRSNVLSNNNRVIRNREKKFWRNGTTSSSGNNDDSNAQQYLNTNRIVKSVHLAKENATRKLRRQNFCGLLSCYLR